ncbi:hypothetical protein WN51_14044 [Melipona quadrifasciata]|uniref:Uncharacterized protein n=1 Tax=Melipona quadrifasciata TaxID=166423 RepID=A0A0M9A0P2_9HYME|nr:hypothetical protein WN51_14044 [Melipona quadrifasciata]
MRVNVVSVQPESFGVAKELQKRRNFADKGAKDAKEERHGRRKESGTSVSSATRRKPNKTNGERLTRMYGSLVRSYGSEGVKDAVEGRVKRSGSERESDSFAFRLGITVPRLTTSGADGSDSLPQTLVVTKSLIIDYVLSVLSKSIKRRNVSFDLVLFRLVKKFASGLVIQKGTPRQVTWLVTSPYSDEEFLSYAKLCDCLRSGFCGKVVRRDSRRGESSDYWAVTVVCNIRLVYMNVYFHYAIFCYNRTYCTIQQTSPIIEFKILGIELLRQCSNFRESDSNQSNDLITSNNPSIKGQSCVRFAITCSIAPVATAHTPTKEQSTIFPKSTASQITNNGAFDNYVQLVGKICLEFDHYNHDSRVSLHVLMIFQNFPCNKIESRK